MSGPRTESDLRNWESRVPIHVASHDYDFEGLVSGARQLSDVVAFDEPFLGDLTGLDFSPSALASARDLAARAGIEATFVESELYSAVDALGAEQFDLVYTGVGALCWLPDVARWAQVVGALLRPGGRLYLREGHPVMRALWDEGDGFGYPYFEGPAIRFESDVSYTDGDARIAEPVSWEWNHGLGEIVQAVIDAGLTVTRLAEHDFCEWQGTRNMVKRDDGKWRLPDQPARLPLMYTLEARVN